MMATRTGLWRLGTCGSPRPEQCSSPLCTAPVAPPPAPSRISAYASKRARMSSQRSPPTMGSMFPIMSSAVRSATHAGVPTSGPVPRPVP